MLLAQRIDLPNTSRVVITEKDVAFGIYYQVLRRLRSEVRVKKCFHSILFTPDLESYAAFVSQIKFSIPPEKSIGRTKPDLVCCKDGCLIGRVGHQDQALFPQRLARGQKEEPTQGDHKTL